MHDMSKALATQLKQWSSLKLYQWLLWWHPAISIKSGRATYTTLACATILASKKLGQSGRRSVEIAGVRVFKEPRAKTMENFLRNLKKRGLSVLQKKLDTLKVQLGDDLFDVLKQQKIGVKFLRKNIDLVDDEGFIIFRGTAEELKLYLAFKRSSPESLIADFRTIVDDMNLNTYIKYDSSATDARFRVPATKPPAAGTAPDFAGSAHLCSLVEKPITSIPLTGSRHIDFIQAFRSIGLEWTDKTANGGRAQIKAILKDYTWHHVDDVDPLTLRGTMQLISKEAHDATISHFGGCHQVKALIGLGKYK